MDRSTFIRIERDGIFFTNGLRHTRLMWSDVNELRVFPALWGEMVQVMSGQAHFEFKTLGVVKFQGEVKGKVGFSHGRDIQEEIIRASGLTHVRQDGQNYYYSRP